MRHKPVQTVFARLSSSAQSHLGSINAREVTKMVASPFYFRDNYDIVFVEILHITWSSLVADEVKTWG